MSIRLQPEDLGVVHVELRLEAGTVNVSLRAEGDATGDLLRQNLGQLRQQLAGLGLSTGRFDVSTGSGGGSSAPEQWTARSQLEGVGPQTPDHIVARPVTNGAIAHSPATRQLDLRM